MAPEEQPKKAAADIQSSGEGLFGRIAISLGYITEALLAEALAEQAATRREGGELRLGQILLKRRLLSTTQFLRVMAEQESIVGGSDQRPTMVRGEFGDPAELASAGITLSPGKLLGRYEILRQIGRGGMGIVYEARDSVLRRRVALKVLREDMVGPAMVRRLEREAVEAARLKHPNIVTLYETGVLQGIRYLSMEYVEGKTLRELIEKGEIDLPRKVEILESVARAVDYAHGRGVIHRDLKPANIMLDSEGRPLIMDFGLARLLDDYTHASRAGALVGTPGYMAPEQITGTSADIDARTDLYALGVLLYEMLSGHLPFEGQDPSAICNKILHEEPPPLTGAPVDLTYIVKKAMARERNARYSTAGELAEELRRFREDEPVRAAPRSLWPAFVRAVRHRRAAAAAIGVAFLGLLVGVGFLVASRVQRQSVLRNARDEARKAEERGDWDSALRWWVKLEELGDEGAAAASREAARRLELGRERTKAAQLGEEAQRAEKVYQELRDRLASLEESFRAASDEVQHHDPPKKKEKLWELERERDQVRLDLSTVEARAVGLHISALRYDPSAAAGLLNFLWSLLEQAETAGDLERARLHEETLRQLIAERNLAEEQKRLDAGGTVHLSTDPEGAEVDLYLNEPAPDRRWIPKLAREGVGRTPLAPIPLARGSYVLVLRKEGYRDTRLPVLVGRGTEQSFRVRLFKDEVIGAGYVYVPGGPFISGDPQAYLGTPRRPRAETGDFFIGKYEITVEEYVEFVNDLLAKGEKDSVCRRRLPNRPKPLSQFERIEGENGPFQIPADLDPRSAVCGISWEDALAYAKWLSNRTGQTYRLPTVAKWEKAARGVDGRIYPWGDRFDWTFTIGFNSFEKPPGIGRVGSIDTDESPYGVRDMGGNVSEFCQDWLDPQKRFKIACGGSHGYTVDIHFRIGTRHPKLIHSADPWVGFRLVKEPPK